MPSSDRGDDFVAVGGPREGLGLQIVLVEKSVDRSLKIDDRFEDAISSQESHSGEISEKINSLNQAR